MLLIWYSQEPQVELWAKDKESSWSIQELVSTTQLLDTNTDSTQLCLETFDISSILQIIFQPLFHAGVFVHEVTIQEWGTAPDLLETWRDPGLSDFASAFGSISFALNYTSCIL